MGNIMICYFFLLKFKLDTDSLFFATAENDLSAVVKNTPEARARWAEMEKYWFCDQNSKIPGPLKVEATISSGSLVILSPKCYILQSASSTKRFFVIF